MPSSGHVKLGTRVMMGIPTLDNSVRSTQWIDCMAGLQMPLGSSMGRAWVENATIAEARNLLCKKAIEADAHYLFMLGDDVLPPPNALITLLEKIGRTYPRRDGELEKAAMVTGIYWTKSYPPEPYIFNGLLEGTYKEWIAGEFFDVDMAGCDCLLIDVEMLKNIPEPWFSTDWVWEHGQKPSSIATEDFYFYAKAREYGYHLFADTTIQCLHEDRHTKAMFGLLMEMPQAGGVPVMGDDEALVADLGSGVATPPELFGNNAKIMRFDMRVDINPDVRCDISRIDEHWFDTFDYVNASHVLEHFRRSEAGELVAHWAHLLKEGGTLILHVPNFQHALELILKAEENPGTTNGQDLIYSWAQIYGDQAESGAPWQHLNGFTKRKLENLLKSIPQLKDITVTEGDEEGFNLRATAVRNDLPWHEALTEMWENAPSVLSSTPSQRPGRIGTSELVDSGVYDNNQLSIVSPSGDLPGSDKDTRERGETKGRHNRRPAK